ncbi:Syndecan [Paragonimus kellicotti]|nr:Syndecan [Paragonimus kellicotti]
MRYIHDPSMFSLLLCSLSLKVLVDAQTRLILPVQGDHLSDVSCHAISQLTWSKDGQANISSTERIREESNAIPSNDGIVIPYRPQCRLDKPELFEARQCNERDCFCVNVTTGVPLHGTHASPSDVGDCSTAVYSILLAIRVPVYPWRNQFQTATDELHANDANLLTAEQDLKMRARVRSGLEQIFKSALGFQRIAHVRRLITVPKTPKPPRVVTVSTIVAALPETTLSAGIMYYRVQLVSTGHSSVDALQDLIQNRLHEGYLPEVGSVDPDVSRVELVQAKVDDPSVLNMSEEQDVPIVSNQPEQRELTSSPHPSAPVHMNAKDTVASKTILVRSSEPDPFGPTPVRLPEEKIERESRQLSGNAGNDLDSHLTDVFVVPPIQDGFGSLQQPWPVRSSREHLLRQPGVIAGKQDLFILSYDSNSHDSLVTLFYSPGYL